MAEVGRPSDYTPETTALICEMIANGMSMREICGNDGMPAMSTVFRWLTKHEDFREQYARAREAQADYLAEEILEIADDASNDWMERKRKDGSEEIALNTEAVLRSKLRVDSRKWLMSKLQPKKYGDKVVNEHGGIGGGPIVVATGVPRDPDSTEDR